MREETNSGRKHHEAFNFFLRNLSFAAIADFEPIFRTRLEFFAEHVYFIINFVVFHELYDRVNLDFTHQSGIIEPHENIFCDDSFSFPKNEGTKQFL